MLGLLPNDGSSWFPRENVGEKIGSDLVNDLVNVGRNFAFRNLSTHKLLFPRTFSRPFWAACDCDLFGCIRKQRIPTNSIKYV